MNPSVKTLLGVLLLVAFSACAGRPPSASEQGERADLVILATSDFHANIERAEPFAETIRNLREIYPQSALLFDGGDLFQGSLEGNLSKGRAVVDLYNLIGFDAAAIGNHELDYGPAVEGRIDVKKGEDGLGNLKKRVKEAKFAWLSANLIQKNAPSCKPGPRCNALGQRTVFAPRAYFHKNETKTCVIGATTPSTEHITVVDFVKNVRFKALYSVVLAESKYLRTSQRCDFVVLVAHAGLLCNKEGRCRERGDRAEILDLLEKLPQGTLDAVVAGHTHLKAQEVIHGTPVIEAGSYARTVGVLKLWKKNRRHEFASWSEVPTKANEPAAVLDITNAMARYRDNAEDLKRLPVGESEDRFEKVHTTELALGNLVADALLEYARTIDGDVCCAFVNQGGLRADLPEGKLNYGDVFRVLPFDNSLAIASLTGEELFELLRIGTSGGHGIFPVAGLSLTRTAAPPGMRGRWDRDLDSNGVSEDWERDLLLDATLTPEGRMIDPRKRYKIATINFLTQGGDHLHTIFDRVKKHRVKTFEGVFLRDIVIEYLKKYSPIRKKNFLTPKRIKERPVSIDE